MRSVDATHAKMLGRRVTGVAVTPSQRLSKARAGRELLNSGLDIKLDRLQVEMENLIHDCIDEPSWQSDRAAEIAGGVLTALDVDPESEAAAALAAAAGPKPWQHQDVAEADRLDFLALFLAQELGVALGHRIQWRFHPKGPDVDEVKALEAEILADEWPLARADQWFSDHYRQAAAID